MDQHVPAATHRVTNQAPPLTDYNAFETDLALAAAVERHGAGWHQTALSRHGAALTTADTLALAELANRHTPELSTHSARGERIDALEFHPSWHQLLALLRGEGLHALPFAEPRAGAMAARCAGYFLHAQLESGSLCPLTMTFASIPVLKKEPALFETLRERLYTREHDPRDIPLAGKRSMMIGMGMTEKQGGSDVRSNETRAWPLGAGGRGQPYRLVGHKWFFSAPQCDAHLVLARTDEHAGISCFYVPRFSSDGSKNAVQVQRLKDKLGNRSNASSEVEFLDAYGVMVGEEGRGVPTIIEMANHDAARLRHRQRRADAGRAGAGAPSRAPPQRLRPPAGRAAAHAQRAGRPRARSGGGHHAVACAWPTPSMARRSAARPRRAAGAASSRPPPSSGSASARSNSPAKAMEVWGGNGYVETGPMARFYREAPVNSIWEGSGNVMCLDVLRAVEREPESAAALVAAWREAAAGHPELLRAIDQLLDAFALPAEEREASARRIAQRIALIAQASLLIRHAPAAMADAFIATRLGAASHDTGRVYGTLPAFDHGALLARAFPA